MAKLQRETGTGNGTARETEAKVSAVVAEVFARRQRRVELGVPNDFGKTVQRARDADADRRWEAETLNPLRIKAVAAARELEATLKRLANAETSRPSLLLARTMLRERALPKPVARWSHVLAKLSDPDFMAKLLPYLVEKLDGDRLRTARRPGRPPASVQRVVEEAARAAGLSRRKVAVLLESEGLEEEGDVQERIRKRRRRRGGTKSSKQT